MRETPLRQRNTGYRPDFISGRLIADLGAWAFDAVVFEHPMLTSFADECCGTLARLIVYVGSLALLAIVGVHFWDQLPDRDIGPSARAVWAPATRSYPAFAVSQPETLEKTVTYEILRHPGGGRKDVLRWAAAAERPIAELEIYRPGDEVSEQGPDLADRMDPNGAGELEAAGVIDSKFGAVTLLRPAGQARGGAPGCLGFVKRLDQPDLRISGWSCQGDTLPARRAAVGCILNRLTLLTAGNDPKLAELFARAELRRGSCALGTTAATTANWVTENENPQLRGAL
jgi:hypothetical protein